MKYERQSGYFQFEEDPLRKNAEDLSKVFHEVALSMNFLKNKPQVKSKKIIFFDSYCTVIISLADKKMRRYMIPQMTYFELSLLNKSREERKLNQILLSKKIKKQIAK